MPVGVAQPRNGHERTSLERNAFMFQHIRVKHPATDLHTYHPLPSQIPFLLDIYSENLNLVIQVVHTPTVTKLTRNLRGHNVTNLSPAQEALMFAIYYAAITSMPEEDVSPALVLPVSRYYSMYLSLTFLTSQVLASFGSPKTDLNLKFRMGFEQALAMADFLATSDIVLVQALSIFLFLAPRYDSPRYVWMMTGVAIRMAQALGLHRDGSHFEHLTPFEVEARRRLWWALCILDVRSSEAQGMDLTIAPGSFDTKLPLNINDADITPSTKQTPQPRQESTDMTFALISFEICDISRQMFARLAKQGALSLEEQTSLVNELNERLHKGYLQYINDPDNVAHWAFATTARLTMCKMTLIVHLPTLFSSPSERFTDETRTRLLVTAIEVAEYNHAFNSEPACRNWREISQTYTQWHAIVYLLIEIGRRDWSPIVERAWIALHSKWLIPEQSNTNKKLQIWVPLRRLMVKASRHRQAELKRLRTDPRAVQQLELEDGKIPLPESPCLVPGSSAGDGRKVLLEIWHKLLMSPVGLSTAKGVLHGSDGSTSMYTEHGLMSSTDCNPAYIPYTTSQIVSSRPSTNSNREPNMITQSPHPSGSLPPDSTNRPGDQNMTSTSSDINTGTEAPWLWNDENLSLDMFDDLATVSMDLDLDLDVDWYNLVESATGFGS